MIRWVAIASTLFATIGSLSNVTLDGTWWLSKNQAFKLGFISGEADCYKYEVRGREYPGTLSPASVEKLDKFYASPSNRRFDVEDATRKIFLRRSGRNLESNSADRYPETHGIFNGDYWWQVDSDGRIGFVNGYIACRRKYFHANISVSPSEISNKITSSYDFYNPSKSIANAKSNRKIADLIDGIIAGSPGHGK